MKWKFLVLIFKGLFVKKQSYKVSPTQFWRWNSCGHLAIGAERGWYDLDPAEQANETVGAHSSRNLPQGVMFINYKPIKNDWVIKKNTIIILGEDKVGKRTSFLLVLELLFESSKHDQEVIYYMVGKYNFFSNGSWNKICWKMLFFILTFLGCLVLFMTVMYNVSVNEAMKKIPTLNLNLVIQGP